MREIARREMTTSNWNLVESYGRGLEKIVVQNELTQQRARKQSAGGTGQAHYGLGQGSSLSGSENKRFF